MKLSALRSTSVFSSGSSAQGTLELWATDALNPLNDGWTEAALTFNNKPSGDRLLATVPLPVADGTVAFSSTNLNTYLNEQTQFTGGGDTTAGNNLASFLIRITGCAAAPSSNVFFAEGSPGSSYGSGPRLKLYNSNAVTLRTFRSADPAVNWPLIAGGAALLALVGGLGVYRWRLSRVRRALRWGWLAGGRPSRFCVVNDLRVLTIDTRMEHGGHRKVVAVLCLWGGPGDRGRSNPCEVGPPPTGIVHAGGLCEGGRGF